jgi:hypothetical protein
MTALPRLAVEDPVFLWLLRRILPIFKLRVVLYHML